MQPILRKYAHIAGTFALAAFAAAALAVSGRAETPMPTRTVTFLPDVPATPSRQKTTIVTALPVTTGTATPGKVSPNKLTAAQAQLVLGADHDLYWKRAIGAFPASIATPVVPVGKWNLFAHGERTRKEIALTFDDGPHPGFTPQLLDVLKEYHVPATFFVVGEMAEKAPDLIREEVADGNEVGNHTFHHVSLVKITPDQAAAEIRACDLVLQTITGKSAHLFRPPGGKYDPSVAKEAAAQGYTTVLWTDDPGDYASPGVDLIADRTVNTAHNGGVLLLHDGIQQTIDALPAIIERLRAEGYTFVTVDKMLGERSATEPVKNAENPVSIVHYLQK